jgi:hypothetical protein
VDDVLALLKKVFDQNYLFQEDNSDFLSERKREISISPTPTASPFYSRLSTTYDPITGYLGSVDVAGHDDIKFIVTLL